MIMTTPNEFLQFAKDMGLGKIKSSSPSQPILNNNGCPTTTGLSVLNNLCRLVEQIHQLKTENNRLRAHLDLVEHVEKFHQRFLSQKDHQENNFPQTSILNEEQSTTISPTNSLKLKHSLFDRELKSIFFNNNNNNQEDSPSIDQDQTELIDCNTGLTSVRAWDKVRHALKFSLRRKQTPSNTPPLPHIDRQIPIISISIESDEDRLQDDERLTKKTKKTLLTTNDSLQTSILEDTDQDDESIQFVRTYHTRRLYGNETPNSSSTERQESPSSTTPLPFNTSTADDEVLLKRKLSKLARYRRKLRSKFDTVKRQFSDQNSSSSIRRLRNSHASTFDDIGSGLNHALLRARLAPALTKSYQQKMLEWQTMQKSHFLVNYRRQSLTPNIDVTSNSRKNSLVPITTEASLDLPSSSVLIDSCSSIADDFNFELETKLKTLGPILSPNQRSLIVHQWREIMSEEISLRYYNDYLQHKILCLKELETDLKLLKTNIFCTKNSIQHQSMINLEENFFSKQSYLPQRCRSLQSLISMPASWILAVQSAAYSDVLDGTSHKTTETAILFNKHFFDQLENFKRNRKQFEQGSIKDLHLLNYSKTNQNHLTQYHAKLVPARGCLRKLSLISSSEFPQYFLPDPVIPLQTTISQLQPPTNIEILPMKISNEIVLQKNLSVSTNHLNKRQKRSRFDFKKSFERSRSMCVTQFNSWLQRRRQQHSSAQRRKSATESKTPTPCSTPTLLGSPRLARLHQRIFKQQPPPSSQTTRTPIPIQLLDDSDNRSQYDLPVRIYFPPLTTPVSRHLCITDINIVTRNSHYRDIQIEQNSNLTTPLMDRKYSSSSSSTSSVKITTAKERRESFATSSNIFHNRFS